MRIGSSKTLWTSLPFLIIALGQVGCSDTDAIIRNGQRVEVPSATIGAEPIAALGGEGAQSLFEIVDAVLLPEAIAVGEGSTGKIHFFSQDGSLLKAVGGKGDGPGEFSRLSWLQATDTRLYAYDRGNSRLSEFDLHGNYLGSISVEPVAPYVTASAVGVLSDGSVIAVAQEFPSDTHIEGVIRRQLALLRYSRSGEFEEHLGYYDGSETYVEPFGRGGQLSSRLTFGRRSGTAVIHGSILVLDNSFPGILRLDPTGTPTDTIYPTLSEQQVIAQSDIRIARTRFVSNSASELDLGGVFDRMSVPDTFPFFGWEGTRQLDILRTSRDGRIWVVHYGGIRNLRPTWSVLNMDGTGEIYVVSPDELEVLDATDDRVLVKRWDEFDVEHLELRPLVY